MENSAVAQRANLSPEETETSEAGEEKTYDLDAEKEKWSREFAAAKKWLQPLKEQAKKIEAIIRDERDVDAMLGESRWNLFAANRETKSAMLYGRPPRVSVERRFSDEGDDVARVAADITTRLLNTDIERTSDGFATALGLALLDRLDCGWSMVRERYVVEWEDVAETPAKMGVDPQTGQPIEVAPAVPAGKRKRLEDVETDYVHLNDQLWQPCRNHHSMGWWAQLTQQSKDDVTERWGADVAAAVPYTGKPPVMSDQYDGQAGAEWNVIAQDLYTELNVVTTRIKKIMEKGIRVTGVYAKQYGELADMLESSGDGVLLPVDNWAGLSGEGGLANAVFFFPTQEMVQCVMQLRDYRRELIDAIAQVTGMSDIMRGEATQAGATATEQRVKTRMGSVRMQAMQDDFARFASEAQRIRAQLMAKFFDEQTIAQRSNAQFLADQQLVPQAIQLIKSPAFSQYRIEVKSESVSLADFAATKAEKFEAAGALAQVFQMGAALQPMGPAAMPFVFKMAKSLIAGMRGTSDMESAFDEAVKMAEQQAQQAAQQGPPPNPQQEAEKAKQSTLMLKGQIDSQKEQQKAQLNQQQTMVDVQADAMREENQRQSNVAEFAQRQQIAAAFRPVKPPTGAP